MNRWLILFLLLLTGLRLYVGGQSELSPDEAYYFQWAQRLDWAYYSKGPGVAAVIRAGTELFGATERGIRFFSPLFALGTCLVLYGLARRLYSESVATWVVLLLSLTPIFQVGSVVMTIDTISLFFWAAALWSFWLALERHPRWNWYWPLTGALIGLGFLAKYTNAMQLLSIVLILALTPRFCRELYRPGFLSLLGVFLLALIPPLVWNAKHAWITLHHLSERGSLDTGFSINPGEWFVFLGIQFGVYSPLVYGAMLAALYWGCRDARFHFKPRFLVLFALPLLILYYGLSIKKAGQANWTGPSFLSLGILTVALWHTLAERKVWARRYVAVGLSLALLTSLVVLNVDAIRAVGFPLSYTKDPGARLRGWKTVAIAVEKERRRLEAETGKPIFLIGNKYQTAATVGFYLPGRVDGPGYPPVFIAESQAIENQFSFWPRYDEMLRPVDFAKRMILLGKGDPERLEGVEELSAAVAKVENAPPGADPEQVKTAHRELVRTMLKIDPTIPLEENWSSEHGVGAYFGHDALYISDGNDPPTALENGFASIECVASWQEYRRGLPLRTIHLFLCRNYQGLSL
ncbi:MAG TPA: glycosyltransferase family 39 protein [Chthoniobacteraceae bacterium]|nr:glycosyltransferase family 39 protein [Chthoniobacteraceae bacterium]